MRYFKRLRQGFAYPNIDEGVIYPDNYKLETPPKEYNTVKGSVENYSHLWKEVSEIEYIKQQGWYIRGSKEFSKWLIKNKVDTRGYDGRCKILHYGIENNELFTIYKIDKNKVEVTIDQLNEIYNSKPKKKEMENFQVNVNGTTSKILQELAFENGWSWRGGVKEVKGLDAKILAFQPKSKDVSMGSLGVKTISLEEAISRLTTKEESFKEGDWVISTNNSLIKLQDVIQSQVAGKGFGWDRSCGDFTWRDTLSVSIKRKATNEEVESALIKEAERRGFVKNSETTIKSVEGIKERIFNLYFENGALVTNGYSQNATIYKDGKWAEIVDEPKEIFGFKVEKTSNGSYKFGCSDHIYTRSELERVVSTLSAVREDVTVEELHDELKDLID